MINIKLNTSKILRIQTYLGPNNPIIDSNRGGWDEKRSAVSEFRHELVTLSHQMLIVLEFMSLRGGMELKYRELTSITTVANKMEADRALNEKGKKDQYFDQIKPSEHPNYPKYSEPTIILNNIRRLISQ